MYPEIVARVLQIDPERVRLSAGDPEGPALVRRRRLRVPLDDVARRRQPGGRARGGARRAGRWRPRRWRRPSPTSNSPRARTASPAPTARSSLLALASGGALDTTTGLAATRAFPSGAHVAEVEIDPETGMTEVVRYTAVDDCGVVMNPTLLEGQILGGMYQGLGPGVRRGVRLRRRTGNC